MYSEFPNGSPLSASLVEPRATGTQALDRADGIAQKANPPDKEPAMHAAPRARVGERQAWKRREWQQADPRGYWDDAGNEPAYYLVDDPPFWVEFAGWFTALQDGELPLPEES